jgi:hypothetical protein
MLCSARVLLGSQVVAAQHGAVQHVFATKVAVHIGLGQAAGLPGAGATAIFKL